ncbi:hypothetical protein Pint_34684 [Pistacia integerrima]|uniref:Uncharacterized protein n=1 Tax=Pistacia integerrima TaxID=434235 RepID=A0ACC0X487_9ROSI|nr:hypothetical protein Pint_34684 [Pistacia integerrima]
MNRKPTMMRVEQGFEKVCGKGCGTLLSSVFPAVVELEKNYVESLVRIRQSVWKRVWNRAWLLVIMFSPGVVALVLTFFLEWQNVLLIATSLMGSACFLFCCGICHYHPRELVGVGSGFSVIFRVIKASVNRSSGHSTCSDHPIDNDEYKFQLSPKVNWLKGFDKVVIIESSTQSQEEQKKFGRISSDTFFPEQGNNMKSSDFSVFLCLTEGIVVTGLDEFTVDHFHYPWKEYVSEINEFISGLGNFLSMLFIQVNKSLFLDTLNKSPLDKYYCRLTIVSFVNMLFYFTVIYIFYGSERGMISDVVQLRRLEEGRELISSTRWPPPMGGESTESNINRWGLIGAILRFRRSLRRPQGYAEVNDSILDCDIPL